MNYYFLIRPPGLQGSITLSNYYPHTEGPIHKALIVHAIYANGQRWICKDLTTLKYGESTTITDLNLPHEFLDQSVFLFLYPEKQPAILDRLIVNDILDSVPAWRSNIKIYSNFSSASYQGEYPAQMSLVPKPTIVSCSPMLQRDQDVINDLILVNMTAAPQKIKRKIRIVDSHKKILKEAEVLTNHHNIVNLDDVLSLTADDMFITLSDEFMGIPLYFSRTKDHQAMSIEHTHPPTEYVVFGNRNYFQKRKKSWWLK